VTLSRYKRLAKEFGWIVIGQIAVVTGALVLVYSPNTLPQRSMVNLP
jgi:hypothetical protein